MIKIQELRVGNWIEDIHGDQFIVTALAPFFVYDESETFAYDKTSPILINDQILRQCGFKENTDGQGFEKEIAPDYWIVVNELGIHLSYDQMEPFISLPYKYLHELQNMWFMLTTSELIYA